MVKNTKQGPMSPRQVTIADVAKAAGVSKTTVSRYLSGEFTSLSAVTLEKIRQTVRALDYHPNQMARGLKQGKSNLIGVILADITNPFSTAILRGVEDVSQQLGYSVMVCNSDNDPQKERDYIFMMQQHRIDGLIINTTGKNNPFLHKFSMESIPVVLVDRKVPDLDLDTVSIDNMGATEEAVKFLIQRGYERIALFTEPVDGISSRLERLLTFRRTLESLGHISASEVYTFDTENFSSVKNSLEHFIENSHKRKRVVFAGNGVATLKVSLAFKDLKLEIPNDCALIGFDDPDWGPLVGPGLTTIAQPTYEIGVIAMKKIISKIRQESQGTNTTELPGRLIVRGSTP